MRKIVTYVALTTLSAIMLSSCSVALTKSQINEMGGIENAKKVQYYVSKKIVLRRVDNNRDATIRNGVLISKSSRDRNKIVISRRLPGVLKDNVDDTFAFVAFEEYEGDPMLIFSTRAESIGAPFLLFLNAQSPNMVTYGGEQYVVSFRRDRIWDKRKFGSPYLIMKKRFDYSRSSRSRKVKGLRVNETY